MPKSQNGWYAAPNLTRRDLAVGSIEIVGGVVDDADVWEVLRYIAVEFDKRIEPLYEPGCWGFYYRPNANDPNSLSNHSSGTAIDLNAPSHPNGVPTAKTFTKRQIGEIRTILTEVDGVVRWGGDYTRTPDAMHFEINAGKAAVAAVARRLREENSMTDVTNSDVIKAIEDMGARLGARMARDRKALGLALRAVQANDDANAEKIIKAVIDGDDKILDEIAN